MVLFEGRYVSANELRPERKPAGLSNTAVERIFVDANSEVTNFRDVRTNAVLVNYVDIANCS
jgi:hypothetical protein